MKNKKLQLLSLCMFCLLCLNCGLFFPADPRNKISIEQKSNLVPLIPVIEDNTIYGIDTVDFKVKAKIKFQDGITIGGVGKFPQGGFITSIFYIGNLLDNELVVINPDCSVGKKFEGCAAPVDPRVYGSKIFVSSSYFTDNGRIPLRCYDAKTYSQLFKFGTFDMTHSWQTRIMNNYLIFGDQDIATSNYSRIVIIDTTTFATREIHNAMFSFNGKFILVAGKDTVIYVANSKGKTITALGFSSEKVLWEFSIDSLSSSNNISSPGMFQPYIRKDNLYIIIEDYPGKGEYYTKFSLHPFAPVMIRKLDKIEKSRIGPTSNTYYTNDYLVVTYRSNNIVRFYSIETGEVVRDVVLP